MTRSIIRFGIPFMGSALVALTVFACSSSDKTSSTGTGGSTSTGGTTTSTGGTATGGGGTSSTGGGGGGGTGGGTGGYAADYKCLNAPPADPGGTAVQGAACCGTFGSCVTASSLSSTYQNAYGHDECTASPDLRCAPTQASLNLGTSDAGAALGVFSHCTMPVGSQNLEGRCIPKCFVTGNPMASQLSANGCPSNSLNLLCAPCYNPIDGSSTGACTTALGDTNPTTVPTPFAKCTGYTTDGGASQPQLGTCVPQTLAAASGNPAVSSLKQQDCTTTGDICVPTLKVQNLAACFTPCQAAVGGDGACVPTFILAENSTYAGYISVLGQGTPPCPTGYTCAPCISPLDQSDTGACD